MSSDKYVMFAPQQLRKRKKFPIVYSINKDNWNRLKNKLGKESKIPTKIGNLIIGYLTIAWFLLICEDYYLFIFWISLSFFFC